jgi:serine/threonine-protein kinase
MSYEEGGSLENLLYPDPSSAMWNLTMKDKIRILTDVANGLQELHRVGIVHRDIKPANILLSCKGGRLHKSQLSHFLCLFVNDGLLV